MSATTTMVFDGGSIETAHWALAAALQRVTCVALYSTWPRWSWEKRR